MLECKNASFGYEGTTVVSDLNFAVSQGDYLCIVGENGSGKSTLIKGILGLKAPADGKVSVNAENNEIGYLPQMSGIRKDFPASVFEVVLSGFCGSLGKRLFYSAAHKSEALSNMEKMGISDIKNKSFAELSGGQRQRVLLARALCGGKRMLVLDEPAASLDPVVTAELYSLVKEVNRGGMTVVMVSHDIKSAVKFASHILHLGNRQLFFGTVEDYRKSALWAKYAGGECNE